MACATERLGLTRPILTFDRHGLTGEVAKVGLRTVGFIIANPGRTGQRAAWAVNMTDWPRRSGPASSFDAARHKIRIEVEDWCITLGWIDPGDGVDVRVLTEDERKARARV